MELVLGLVVGLIVGLMAGASVVAVRAERERRRRQAATEAELQAARQRAERAIGEAQALRTKLAAAEIVAGRSADPDAAPGPSGVAATVARSVVAPPIRVTPQVAPEPVPELPAVPGPVEPAVPVVAPEPAPSAAPAPRTRVSRSRPMPATEQPVSDPPSPATPPPPVAPVVPRADPDPVVEAGPAASANGWRPIRPGLSDPHAWLGTPAPNGTPYAEDDLERIHGVGPYLARRLRDEGILTYRQIAEWSEDDMALVSRRIGSFPDRVRREDWPASARERHAAVYGETLS